MLKEKKGVAHAVEEREITPSALARSLRDSPQKCLLPPERSKRTMPAHPNDPSRSHPRFSRYPTHPIPFPPVFAAVNVSVVMHRRTVNGPAYDERVTQHIKRKHAQPPLPLPLLLPHTDRRLANVVEHQPDLPVLPAPR